MFAVELLNITKRFDGVVANDQVTFRVLSGEVHALVGENGAGKSTLMNVLYGLHRQDDGEIWVNGNAVAIANPLDAIRHGIGMVHQHFMLVNTLTAMENIILGRVPSRWGLIDTGKAKAKISTINKEYSLVTDLDKPVYELSVGEMQRVEILKALYRGAEILILDEPTAVLTPQQAQELFAVLKDLVRDGRTVIFISHKLREVFAISDRITVLRDGRVTGVVKAEETDEHELARLMVGREVKLQVEKTRAVGSQEVLRVEDLSAVNNRGLPALHGLTFTLHRGEIVGIAGVDGNGQDELIEVLSGLRRADGGRIGLAGREITSLSIRERRELGVAHIPADRLQMGVEASATVAENIILNRYYRAPLSKWIVFRRKEANRFARAVLTHNNIVAAGLDQPASGLSGGNMQKLVIGREMEGDPLFLIAAQPTRGVDIGAIAYIHNRLVALRDSGSAILLISSELEEILALSDRILVIYEGCFVAEFAAGTVTEAELGLAMVGA